jgi:hypothetical protein
MKKIILSFLITNIFMFAAFGQISIQYSIHALQAGIDNPMSYCSYVEPGQSGADITWDFSALKFEKPFTGFVKDSRFTGNQLLFPKANIELGEFDSRFYFDVNENQTNQYGYVSADGKTREIYSVPFVKMKYPFTYGDAYSGIFAGTYEFADKLKGDISGIYSVDADGYGALLLPGNVRYENVLRIKTTKNYKLIFQNFTQEISVSTYRWYNSTYKYPLLVLTEYITKTGENESIDHQAAYNSNAINTKSINTNQDNLNGISLFPNPVRNSLIFRADFLNEGDLNFQICDLAGKQIRAFNRQISETGACEFDISSEISDLKPATYILVAISGTTKKSLNFTLTK